MSPLNEILSGETLQSHFQPIVSVRGGTVVGAEALVRATTGESGSPVPAPQLFEWAAEEDQLLELDRLCRRKALQAFKLLKKPGDTLMLFVNLEASLLDMALRRGHFLAAVTRAGLRPRDVVIEISEAEVLDSAALADFAQRYRAQGFLIALDDLGSGHSNLERWQSLEPDIVKIDRSLVHGIASNPARQRRLRSMIALSREMGTLVLAEGLEDAGDVDSCLDQGVDLFQGYYFGHPVPPEQWSPADAMESAGNFSRRREGRGPAVLVDKGLDAKASLRALDDLARRISWMKPEAFDNALATDIFSSNFESLRILDRRGVQVSSTAFHPLSGVLEGAGLLRASDRQRRHLCRESFFEVQDGGVTGLVSALAPSPDSGRLSRSLSVKVEHLILGTLTVCGRRGGA